MNTVTQTESKNWKEALAVYTRPRVFGMIFLGFSAGLPFLLVFTTLSAWLAQAGVSRTSIGFFSWVGITYSIKVFWAPVVDRLPLPLLTRLLGKRRSWMLLAQFTIAVALMAMAYRDPSLELFDMAVLALVVAFGSATQDIVIDAYRIEAVDKLLQGAMAATYVLGYRLALLAAGAGALFIAGEISWQASYTIMALLMLVGIITTLVIREPEHSPQDEILRLESRLEKNLRIDTLSAVPGRVAAWFIDAVVSPFVEFFQRNGWLALVILLLIGSYRISDITMGVMANPFYLDKGFSLAEIAAVSKVYGFFMSILGAGIGGVLVLRYGILRPLLLGAVLVMVTNLCFLYLVFTETSVVSLAMVISADNLSGGIASSVFIAYLSSLTNTAYTATQYALFSSFMTLPGKMIGGLAGVVVDSAGYGIFFAYSSALGLPGMLLILYLLHRQQAGPVEEIRPGSA